MQQLYEEWIDHFATKIPVQNYTMQMEFGEGNGLLIHLYSDKHNVVIDFGIIEAVNVLDEGVLLNDPWDCSGDKLPDNGFVSTIYLIKNGRYLRYIESYLGSDLSEASHLNQYNIVTQNYVVMVVGRCDPEIKVESLD